MSMQIDVRLRRILAPPVAVALLAAGSPALALDGGTLTGVVIRSGSLEPVAGARVHAADPDTGAIRTSSPTSPDGTFAVTSLPDGSYELGVEADGGLYLVPTSVRVDGGVAPPLHLAVAETVNVPAPGEDGLTPSGTRHLSVWDNPLTATLVVLGIAAGVGLLIDQAFEDDDKSTNPPASPFLLEE